ncbi:MAG TPA: DUF3592 domain-containing protein [Ktedonobacteraceae bacterium]|nr:DUF3592 domain-containing protein [Ktedonobacteraceae bacterium]
MRTQNTPYSSPMRGRFFTFLLLLPLSLLTGLVQIHTYLTYQTYQQGRCTITSGNTEYHSSKNSHYYTSEFRYTVLTKDGQQVDASGYKAPYTPHYHTYQEARQVVDSYTVGQTYDCWYNPADPTHAALVFRGYTINDFTGDYLLTSFLYLIGYSILWWLFYYVFYRNLCLLRRGVLTQGRVVGHSVRRSRSGQRTYSRISFSPFQPYMPYQFYQVETAGAYMINSPQPVCYDPVNPRNARYGGRPGGCLVTTYLAVVIIGILIASGALLVLWYWA